MKVSVICILILLFFVNCSSSTQLTSKKVSPVGQWEVVKADFIGTKEDLVNGDKSMNLYTFFGAAIWAKSKGKLFIFNSDGTWNSDMVPPEVAGLIELTYEFDTNFKIFVNSKTDSTHFEFPLEVVQHEEEIMIWKFGNYMNVQLKRIR